MNERILNIIKEIQKESSVSINKIILYYNIKYGIILSKTTVHRKLRYKLKYSFKKTSVLAYMLKENKNLYSIGLDIEAREFSNKIKLLIYAKI